MKVLIVGAGAIGCSVGANFYKGGADVVLFDVWQEHVDTINKNGLRFTDASGKVENLAIPATTSLAADCAPDLVLILTKYNQTEEALQTALSVIGENTLVMSVQNGLANFDIIEKYVGRDRMIIGCTISATTITGPGEARDDDKAYSYIQALGETGETMISEIKTTLERGGMGVEVSKNIYKEIWQKLSFNAAMNPITGITRLVPGRLGELGAQTATWIAEEVALVAEAEGVMIDKDFRLNMFRRLTSGEEADMTHLTSMLQDVIKERKTEVDAICGAVVERAHKHGIKIPHLETAYNLMKIIEANYDHQLSPQD